MKIRFTPEAAEELVEAQAWYEAKCAGLGGEFQNHFAAAAAAIAENPKMYPVLYRTCRRVFVRRFPYFLLYDIVDDTVVVLGCIHFARNPAIWKRRRTT